MRVIKAGIHQVSAILDIISKAKLIMQSNGNSNQWINGYPSYDTISSDIFNGNGFLILKNDEIRGYFCFIQGNDPEPTYRVIKEGKWVNNEPYGVIHRLASDGVEKGVADTCFNYCFNQINNIKVDTHPDNSIMQNYFKKIGFEYCGIINVSDGSKRLAYQKSIN